MSINKTLDDILEKEDTQEDDGSYRPFKKFTQQVSYLRIIFKTGNQQLLPLNLIGKVDYNIEEDAIAITFAGETLLIMGKKLDECIDLIFARNIAYIKEAPHGYRPKSESEPIVSAITWVDNKDI